MITFLSTDSLALDFGRSDPALSSSMDSLAAGPLESASEKHTPSKLRRSCELCRASKGKCIPSKEDVKRCQK